MLKGIIYNFYTTQVTSKMIRATLNVGMVCQTITNKPVEPGKEYELSRDDVSCKIIYAANGMFVNNSGI